mgnify:CR=1 FL=1
MQPPQTCDALPSRLPTRVRRTGNTGHINRQQASDTPYQTVDGEGILQQAVNGGPGSLDLITDNNLSGGDSGEWRSGHKRVQQLIARRHGAAVYRRRCARAAQATSCFTTCRQVTPSHSLATWSTAISQSACFYLGTTRRPTLSATATRPPPPSARGAHARRAEAASQRLVFRRRCFWHCDDRPAQHGRGTMKPRILKARGCHTLHGTNAQRSDPPAGAPMGERSATHCTHAAYVATSAVHGGAGESTPPAAAPAAALAAAPTASLVAAVALPAPAAASVSTPSTAAAVAPAAAPLGASTYATCTAEGVPTSTSAAAAAPLVAAAPRQPRKKATSSAAAAATAARLVLSRPIDSHTPPSSSTSPDTPTAPAPAGAASARTCARTRATS